MIHYSEHERAAYACFTVRPLKTLGQYTTGKVIPIEAYRASDATRHRGRQRLCRHPRFARTCIHMQLIGINSNVLVRWHGLRPTASGFVPLSIAEFSL